MPLHIRSKVDWANNASSGRTSGKSPNGETIRYISSKNVSRRHLTLHISPATPDQSTSLTTHSHINATDGSKVGTIINGERIREDTKRLDEGSHTIRLGTFESIFRLTWRPVVLSFTSLPKKLRNSSNALAAEKERFGDTGIKLLTEYVTNHTTHALAQKRNTVPGLQALVQGRWLLTDKFADALARVCERKGVDEDGRVRPSALETDFEANWPREEEFYVPSGGEPVARPDELLRPDGERAEVFRDFVFVFLHPGQFDQLMPVVSGGGGKALLFDSEAKKRNVRQAVEFVRGSVGKKDEEDFRLTQVSGPGGVVIVRLKNVEDEANAQFTRDLDLTLDQRSMEQNEFLDAILIKDASGLRQALPEASQSIEDEAEINRVENANGSREASAAIKRGSSPVQEASRENSTVAKSTEEYTQAPTQQSTKSRTRRIITHSRFQGFDDFDPSQIVRVPSDSPEPPLLGIISEGDEDVSQDVRNTRSRKRGPPDEDPKNPLSRELPGAQAMKKLKLEALSRGEKSFTRASAEPDLSASNDRPDKSKRGKKDATDPVLNVDVKAQMRARKEREEAEAAQQHGDAIVGEDGEEIPVNIKIRTFELPVRPPRDSFASDTQALGDSWNPAWNGRKNFKRFRSNRRQQSQLESAPQSFTSGVSRAFIRLEKVPRPGMNSWHHDDFDSQPRSRSGKKSRSRPPVHAPQSNDDEAGEDETSAFRRRVQRSHEEDEQAASLDDGIIIDAGRSSAPAASHQDDTQQSKAAGKRAATSSAMGPPPPKKPKTRAIVNIRDDDDSDDDPTAFRRRRR